MASNLLGGAAGLAAAWSGWGAWSLVAQRGVTELVGTAMAWQSYPWWPGRGFSTRVLRDLSGYSITMKPESLARFEFPDGEAWAGTQDGLGGPKVVDPAPVGGGA